jgi:hypothetical protein
VDRWPRHFKHNGERRVDLKISGEDLELLW